MSWVVARLTDSSGLPEQQPENIDVLLLASGDSWSFSAENDGGYPYQGQAPGSVCWVQPQASGSVRILETSLWCAG